MRYQIEPPWTAEELQSSDTARVTTVTMVGSPSTDISRANFAQLRSLAYTISMPASHCVANSTFNFAVSTKSRAGRKSSRGALLLDLPSTGEMYQSVDGPAAIVRRPFSIFERTAAFF